MALGVANNAHSEESVRGGTVTRRCVAVHLGRAEATATQRRVAVPPGRGLVNNTPPLREAPGACVREAPGACVREALKAPRASKRASKRASIPYVVITHVEPKQPTTKEKDRGGRADAACAARAPLLVGEGGMPTACPPRRAAVAWACFPPGGQHARRTTRWACHPCRCFPPVRTRRTRGVLVRPTVTGAFRYRGWHGRLVRPCFWHGTTAGQAGRATSGGRVAMPPTRSTDVTASTPRNSSANRWKEMP